MQLTHLRFVLPRMPERTTVLGPGVDETHESAELTIAPAGRLADAVATRAPMILLAGRCRSGKLERAGYAVRRFLALPEPSAPEIVLPLDRPIAARYAIERWTVAPRRWKHVRNRVFQALIAKDALPPLGRSVTLGLLEPGPPFLIAAAHQLGVPQDPDWFLTFGRDPDSRHAFFLFPGDSDVPKWLLKFARATPEAVDREEQAFAALSNAGPVVLARAPKLLGRFRLDDHEVSLETAAVGVRLSTYLRSRGSRSDKVAALERVAGWVVDVARATARPPELLEAERARLARQGRVAADLVTRIPPVPAVLQHNDLWADNVVVDGASFTAVDWVGTRRHGLPLWDLLWLLTNSLPILDRAEGSEERVRHFARLFRGELPSSELLFRWIGDAVEASAIPPDAVAPITTLCWLDYGATAVPFADTWLAEPGLGPDWDAWRR